MEMNTKRNKDGSTAHAPDAATLKFVRTDLKNIKRVLDEDNLVLACQIVANLLDWISYYTGEEIT